MKKISRNSQKGLILVVLCIILLLIYGGARIYALFYSELNGKVQLENGTWNIIVNETDITRGTDVAFVIDNINIQENEHVKPGNFAPGLTGDFKININPKDTDVSVRYNIILDDEKLTNKNIQIKSIKETKEENELVKVDKNTYAGIISLDEIKQSKTNEITVNIEWIDDETDNDADIQLGSSSNAECQIPIIVHVCQYLGEELEPYTEILE